MNWAVWLVWLVMASLMGLLHARAPGRPTVRMQAALVFAYGALIVASWLVSGGAASLDGGQLVLGGIGIRDHFTDLVDASVGAALMVLGAQSWRRTRTQDDLGRAHAQQDGLRLLCAMVAGFGVGLAAHGSDLMSVWAGLELSALAAMVTLREGMTQRQRRRARSRGSLALALGALGLVLIFGATADVGIAGLGARVSKVFNHWGGSQRYVYTLADAGERLPAGFVAQARGRVITSMAGVSLLLPGVLALSAAFVLRLFDRQALLGMNALSGLTRLAALAALARVFVSVLHAPRLVNEPYGWAGPLIAVGLAWGAFALWRAHRARHVGQVVSGLLQFNVGQVLVMLVVAANFYGHRALANRPVAPKLELRWAQYVGDEAMAAGLALFLGSWAAGAAALLCLAWMGLPRSAGPVEGGGGVHDLQGRGRVRTLPSVAMLACLGTLAGLPFTPGFASWLISMQSLMAHTELRWVMVVCVLMWMAAILIVARLGWLLFSEPAPGVDAPSPDTQLGGPSLGAAALVCMFAWLALRPEHALERLRSASAGMSMGAPSQAREVWLRERRQRRSRGEVGFQRDAPVAKERADEG